MDGTKEKNLKFVNTYFDKLRADLIELLETNDDITLDIEPIGGDDTHCPPREYVPAETRTVIKQGSDLKFELIDYTVNGG